MTSDPTDPPSWTLIAVLFSTLPLSDAVAKLLHRTAFEMYRSDEGERELQGAMIRGRVVSLRRDMLLGTIGGPAFEAAFDTERGSGSVRFLLTKQGIAWTAAREDRGTLN